MNPETQDDDGQQQRGCNVNSTFNFAVGIAAIAAALLFSYLVYAYL